MPALIETLPKIPAIDGASLLSKGDVDQAAQGSQPLLIRGLLKAWPALAAGRQSAAALFEYLLTLDRGLVGAVMEAPASAAGRFGYQDDIHELTFSVRNLPVRDSLRRILQQAGHSSAPVVAIQMLPLATHMPEFLAQNSLPLLPGVAPLLWIGGPVRTQIHHDRDHNLACVIAGRRRFVLFPPDQLVNLYVGPIDNPPPLSLVNLEAPDFEHYPRFADALASAVVAELGPGDALLMPRYWWHHVSSLEPLNAMVNYWWGAYPQGLSNPYECFLSALLALKELPAAERRYWQAMFESYVFALGDDALAHIPADLRGVLGHLDSHARGKLLKKLKATILKSS